MQGKFSTRCFTSLTIYSVSDPNVNALRMEISRPRRVYWNRYHVGWYEKTVQIARVRAQPIPASSENCLLTPFPPDVLEKNILQRRPTPVQCRGQSFYLTNITFYTFKVIIKLSYYWAEVSIRSGNLWMISIWRIGKMYA